MFSWFKKNAPTEPEPEPKPEPVKIPQRSLTEHELHVKAHHENLLRIRELPEGPERTEAFNKHQADAQQIRMYKNLNYTQETLRAQYWELTFQSEDLLAAIEAEPPGDRRFALARQRDAVNKERSHIVFALHRKDGSFNVTEPIGDVGPRPVRHG